MRLRECLLAACLALLLPGCAGGAGGASGGFVVTGLIYTHTVVPLDINSEATPEQDLAGKSDWKTFTYVVRFDWNTSAIADAARAAGITHIYYADMETFSVWFGLWREQTAIVYGTGPGSGGTPPPVMPGPDG